MKRKHVIVIFITACAVSILFALLTSRGTLKQISREIPGTKGKDTELPERVDSQITAGTILATARENFVITLNSNMTTGYHWELAKPLDKNRLELVGSKYIEPSTKLIGAGGKEVWTFKALKTGKATVFLKYIRPWEKNVAPAREKTFNIIIR